MDVLGFALSAAAAQVMTNLDNLAMLVAIFLPIGPARALGGYVLAQGIALAAAALLASGAATVLAGNVGYLGMVPLWLGLSALMRRDADGHRTLPPGASLMMTTLLFLSLSADSFVVMTSLLADSAPAYRGAALAGAWVAIVLTAIGGSLLARLAERSARWLFHADRFAPYVMIAAGAYVLWNTGTDLA